MKPLEAIRCTHPRCRCECFAPGRQLLRYCDTCNHGWVAHALDKLGANFGLKMEMVQPNIVFDIASLMLYGAQATPVRLKILLDRLFAELQHEDILQILHGFGWTYEDYARGYILQDKLGGVLDNWCVATHEEELVVLQQFLRFRETKTIAHEILLQDIKNNHGVLKQTQAADSSIKKFLERSNLSIQNYAMPYDYTSKSFVTRPFQFLQSANRIIPAPVMPQICSPSGEPHFLSFLQTPAASSTPLILSPLNHPGVLAHSDSRAEQPSCAVKPSHEGLDNCATPNCDSPQDLSNASSLQSHQSLQTHQRHQDQGSDEMDGSDSLNSGSDDGDALDYSKSHISSSLADENKIAGHIRKSSNPTKRDWAQSANFDSTFMGSNGKKRALCTVCNKTFCDKGALKIHYSAVHLKEMHKCTVEGCQMMFSSRRSRNRHSANLNPKLHMPHKQTSDFDHPEDENLSKMNALIHNIASSSITNSISSVSDAPSIHLQPPVIFNTYNNVIAMSSPVDFLASYGKRIKLEHNQPTNVAHCTDDTPYDLSKKLDNDTKLEIDLDRCSDEKDSTIQEVESESITNNQCVTQDTQEKAASASRHNGHSDRVDEGRHPLNLDRDQMLHFRKNSALENVDIVRSSSPHNVEKHVGVFQKSGLSHFQDSEITEGKESRNSPACTTLQWVDSSRFKDASKDLTRDEALLTAGMICTLSEERNKKEIAASARDDSEENKSPPDSDAIQDDPSYMDNKYPFQCKICCKHFKESFSLNIHFQNHHLNYIIPPDADRSRVDISSDNNQTC